MTYRLKVSDSPRDGIVEVAVEQIDEAISHVRAVGRDREAVHSARKNFKRLRALLLLLKGGMPDKKLKAEQKRIAQIARRLASARDSEAALGAAITLEEEHATPFNARIFSDLKSWLQAHRDRVEEEDVVPNLASTLSDLRQLKRRVSALRLEGLDGDDLLGAASEIYASGRKAMAPALKSKEAETLHQWRKFVQRHWRHMDLLAKAWPEETKVRIELAHKLSDLLGTHNDLAVLESMARSNSQVFKRPSDVEILSACIVEKQRLQRQEMALLGERLFAEKPKAFEKRLRAYWDVARRIRKVKRRGRKPSVAAARTA